MIPGVVGDLSGSQTLASDFVPGCSLAKLIEVSPPIKLNHSLLHFHVCSTASHLVCYATCM